MLVPILLVLLLLVVCIRYPLAISASPATWPHESIQDRDRLKKSYGHHVAAKQSLTAGPKVTAAHGAFFVFCFSIVAGQPVFGPIPRPEKERALRSVDVAPAIDRARSGKMGGGFLDDLAFTNLE